MRPNMLDHIVIATPNLADTVSDIARATGVTAHAGGVHPGFGTRNYLVGLGQGQYLELIGADPETGVKATVFDLDRTTRARVATWAVRPEDSAEFCRQANEHGIEVGELSEGSRRTKEGDLLTWQLTRPLAADPSGIVPFVIDWGSATTPGRSLPAELELASFTAWSPEPDTVRQRLDQLGIALEVLEGEQAGLGLALTGPAGTWTLPQTPLSH